MSSFWSWYISILTVGNILACYWLVRWSSRRHAGEAPQGEVTGHVWDGDLQEYNNPLPRWWLWLFYITIVFGLVYLALYPGLGNYKGYLHWTELSQYHKEMQAAKAKYGPIFAKYEQESIVALAANPKARAIGQRIFLNNCAKCHGADAGGGPGFPNLTDNDWLFGGQPKTIETTILHGRSGTMPAWGKVLGDKGVDEAAAYVESLSGRKADPQLVKAGRAKFQTYCIACHGADGKGNQTIGAPNLTDNIWLFGGSPLTIKETIRNGRQGHMPAWGDFLGKAKVHLVAAYIYSLSAEKH